MNAVLPPFDEGQHATIDGYLVARIRVSEHFESGRWSLTLDDRFGVVADNIEELDRWLWLVANAIAIGEGLSCHGKNSRKMSMISGGNRSK